MERKEQIKEYMKGAGTVAHNYPKMQRYAMTVENAKYVKGK